MKLRELLTEYDAGLASMASQMAGEIEQNHYRHEYGGVLGHGSSTREELTTDALFLNLLIGTAKNVRDSAYDLKWITTKNKKSAKLTTKGKKKVPKNMYSFKDTIDELEHITGNIKAASLYLQSKKILMNHIR